MINYFCATGNSLVKKKKKFLYTVRNVTAFSDHNVKLPKNAMCEYSKQNTGISRRTKILNEKGFS